MIKYTYYFGASHVSMYRLVDGSFRFEETRAIKDLSITDPELATALKVAARMANSHWAYIHRDDAGNIIDAPEGYTT